MSDIDESAPEVAPPAPEPEPVLSELEQLRKFAAEAHHLLFLKLKDEIMGQLFTAARSGGNTATVDGKMPAAPVIQELKDYFEKESISLTVSPAPQGSCVFKVVFQYV